MAKKKIQAIMDFIESAETSLKSARKLLKEIVKEENINFNEEVEYNTKQLHKYDNGEQKIIEGVFTGEEMFGADGNKYAVPVNYASKSKLVQGDKLKLTIMPNGKMLYKQILPIERTSTVGLLIEDKGKFKVVADGKNYVVLKAAVTHFKAEIGDSISILTPKGKEATFAAIEGVIPKD